MSHSKQYLLAVLFSASLLAMTPAQAAAPAGNRVVLGIGYWIADQGNRALRDIREELRQQLTDRVKPLVPRPRRGNAVPPRPARKQ